MQLSLSVGLALGVALGCGGSNQDTTVANTAATPAAPATVTINSDDEFLANGREIMRRLVAIFTTDGNDCAKLAADITKLSQDPIWPASTHYEDAHPDVRETYATEQAEMGQQFGSAVVPAMTACADNDAFAAALAKMR